MEKDQEQKHICKFCSKNFPCGRSLGGHMRSHLITIPSSSPSSRHHKKKLPPPSIDHLTYGLRENPKKTSKLTKASDDEYKSCKECGKAFQSWKALFGHMKCHSVNANAKTNTNCLDEDSSNSCSDPHKQIMDSQSDNEAATPSSCKKKKKRSDRMMKRYTAATPSSSLTIVNSEQEEVALSLIILSRDKGEWVDNRIKKRLKKLKSVKQLEVSHEAEVEFEVNSPKNLSKKNDDDDQFERKKNSSRKRKASDNSICHEHENKSKFTCSICKKAFQSYQALGGHRASHKKFKGCCAPENSLETENSHNQSESLVNVEKAEVICKKSKDHECPICFKVFPSGQALGGHRRSHLITDQSKNTASDTEKPAREFRGFLDLNLPAPAEEECNEFKPWWIGAGHDQQPPLLGLLSS